MDLREVAVGDPQLAGTPGANREALLAINARVINVSATIHHDACSRADDGNSGLYSEAEYLDMGENSIDAIRCAEQDAERLEGWQNDRWFYTGVMVRATIEFDSPFGKQTHELHDSVWGVESDSEWDYFIECASDMYSEVCHELYGYGFTIRDIPAITFSDSFPTRKGACVGTDPL